MNKLCLTPFKNFSIFSGVLTSLSPYEPQVYSSLFADIPFPKKGAFPLLTKKKSSLFLRSNYDIFSDLFLFNLP